MIKQVNIIISFNDRFKIIISKVQNHYNVFKYSETSKEKILHFIHVKSKFNKNDKKSIKKMID